MQCVYDCAAMASKPGSSVRVAVMGAGVSGLVSIKSCVEEGIEPVCFERRSTIGGLWNYSDEVLPEEGAALYMSTVLNNSKEMGCFSNFPFPKEYTPFISHQKALMYINDYAKHFDLRKYIQFNTTVSKVEKNEDGGKYWKVTVQKDDSSTEEYFDYVMICTGIFSKKHMPEFPGLETFEGIKIHANEYRDAMPYRGMKVVVVGSSHTAGEVACEIARNNAEVYICIRNGTLCVSRLSRNGGPFDMQLFSRYNLMRSATRFRSMVISGSKTRIPDYSLVGLQSNNPTSLMINDEIQDRIVQGQLTPVVGIEEFGKNSVKLKDGTVLEDINAVIFATGYEISLPIIKQSWIYDDSNNMPLYKYVFPLAFEDPERLALVGMVPVIGPNWPLYEMQARWATRVFTGNIKLPDREIILRDIQQKPIFTGKRYKKAVPFPLSEELAEDLGVKPKRWKLALSDPKLAYLYEYGPMVPYWYRLQGPGAWSGARDAILNVWENTTYPTKRYRPGAGDY
ncbi:dimethylaniline monooxygenase [N-oxide-forming] 2-like [Glandiceps talaboti]